MRTLYLIPDKTGEVYIAPTSCDCCFMDTAVTDTAGLTRELYQWLGMVYETIGFNDRLCTYYKLLRNWLESHPGNIMSASFKKAPLSTARRMLLWRDALKMAQWDFECEDSDSRLGALAGVEPHWEGQALPDMITALIQHLDNAPENIFSDLEIKIPTERSLLRPILGILLDKAERLGATIEVIRHPGKQAPNLKIIHDILFAEPSSREEDIKINLDTADPSFRILEFETAADESEFAAVCRRRLDADLIIQPDAKQADNRLFAIGQPTAGSSMTSRSRILSLLPLALSLYDEHMDIRRLLEWLSSPAHPLPDRFRYKMADTIVRTGGYLNFEIRNIVDNFEFEGMDEIEDDEVRRKLVRLYVPYIKDTDTSMERQAEATLRALADWATRQVAIQPDDEDGRAEALQFGALADSIRLVLEFAAENDGFSLPLAREWAKEIPGEITLPQHAPLAGSELTVSAPWDIVSPAPSVAWIGMESHSSQSFDCDFLLPDERDAVEGHINLWDRSKEGRYKYLCSVMPFAFVTERLTLCFARKKSGDKTIDHPILSRLRLQIENLEIFITSPSEMKEEARKLRTREMTPVERDAPKAEYRFGNADRICFSPVMGATTLEKFVVYPFDYLFERILGIHSSGIAAIPSVSTSMGKVAHEVIKTLFEPVMGTLGYASDIRVRVSRNFESAFSEAVDECGALLLLPENKLEKNRFRADLKNCLETLLDIMETNGLAVCECEQKKDQTLPLPGAVAEDVRLLGYIDMLLETQDGTRVVFDFKWTSSSDYFKNLLEQNRSVQLAVYSHLVKMSATDRVLTAYFTMPAGILYTCAHFRGSNVEVVEPENIRDILEQVSNSISYRVEQLSNGILEECESVVVDDTLSYQADSAGRNLFPLPLDNREGTKRTNRFSEYGIFKGL